MGSLWVKPPAMRGTVRQGSGSSRRLRTEGAHYTDVGMVFKQIAPRLESPCTPYGNTYRPQRGEGSQQRRKTKGCITHDTDRACCEAARCRRVSARHIP